MIEQATDVGAMAIDDKESEKDSAQNSQKIVLNAEKRGNTVKQKGQQKTDRHRGKRNVFRKEQNAHEDNNADRENEGAEGQDHSCGAKHALTALKAEEDGVGMTEHDCHARNVKNGV